MSPGHKKIYFFAASLRILAFIVTACMGGYDFQKGAQESGTLWDVVKRKKREGIKKEIREREKKEKENELQKAERERERSRERERGRQIQLDSDKERLRELERERRNKKLTEQAFLPPTRQEFPNSWPLVNSEPCRPTRSSRRSPLKLPHRPHIRPASFAGTVSSRKLTPSHRMFAPKT